MFTPLAKITYLTGIFYYFDSEGASIMALHGDRLIGIRLSRIVSRYFSPITVMLREPHVPLVHEVVCYKTKKIQVIFLNTFLL